MDYAGPVHVRYMYNCSTNTYKAWIFLFTCSTHNTCCLSEFSVWLLSSGVQACIRGLNRFFSRRCVPQSILSDNRSNFTAEETKLITTTLGVLWRFNPSASPWWGGLFERLVRSTERCLKKVLILHN